MPGIYCTYRLLGAEHDYPSMAGQICQGVGKGSKVGDAGAENLVATTLAGLVGFAGEVALHRGVAFRVGRSPVECQYATVVHHSQRLDFSEHSGMLGRSKSTANGKENAFDVTVNNGQID